MNQVSRTEIITLRGGGCGASKASNSNEPSARRSIIQELPASLLSITQSKIKNLKSKLLMLGDKAVQDEYLNTINWLDVNEYWYQRITDDKSKMAQSIQLLSKLLLEILEIVEQIIDASRFIAYSLIRVSNNFSRIMVVYYTNNDGKYLDLDLSNNLKEKISSIKDMIEQFGEISLYYNGLQYESGITEACINICPVDNPEGKKLGLDVLKELFKSAINLSPSDDLYSKLQDFAIFGLKALYQKYKEQNFKEMMIKCLFIEQLKWTIVNEIQKESFQLKQIFNVLARFSNNEVVNSNVWEVKYCWIKANHWIMGYRVIITQQMFNQEQTVAFNTSWQELISRQLIYLIDRQDQRIGAIINEKQLQKIDLSNSNPLYPQLIIFCRSLNRIKTKILNGSESLPRILQYHEEFCNNNNLQQNETNQKIIHVQNQLDYFNIGSMLSQFTLTQALINNMLTSMTDLSELISDFNYKNIDQYIVDDINQQSRLIQKQVQELKQIMLKLRIAIIQFGFVADNFSQIQFYDEQVDIGQFGLIRLIIIIRQTCGVLAEHQTFQNNNQQYKSEYQINIIKYIEQVLQNTESETKDIKDQDIKQKIIKILTVLMKDVLTNKNTVSQINTFEQLSQSMLETISKKQKEINFILVQILLQHSKSSFQKIDIYLEKIEKMNMIYSQLSFIPLQYINQQSAQLQQNMISYEGLTELKIEVTSSARVFNEINNLFQQLIINRISLGKLYSELVMPKTIEPNSQQNKLILEEDISLKFKVLDIFKQIVQQNQELKLQQTYPIEHMDGILELQKSFIKQYEIMAYQLQKIIENVQFINTKKIEGNLENDPSTILRQTLIQTQIKIQTIRDYRTQFREQNEKIIVKFQNLFRELKSDENYLLRFIKLNENLKIQQWNIRMMNKELYEKIKQPEAEKIIQNNSSDQPANQKSYEQIKQVIINMELMIIQIIDTFGINDLENLMKTTLENPSKWKISESTLQYLIKKFNSFNNTDSKEFIQINILSDNLKEYLNMLKDGQQDGINQQDCSQNDQSKPIEPTIINTSFNNDLSQQQENHLLYSNSLKQVIKYNDTANQIEQNVPIDLQLKKSEYLFNLINNNFYQIISLELMALEVEQQIRPEVTNLNELVNTGLLQKFQITQNISQDQVKYCLQQGENSTMVVKSTKQIDDHFWRFRECQLFNVLITQQKLINQYEIEYGLQLIILKAIETDNRIQKILKSSDFVLQQQNALDRHWKQQSDTIQQLISQQLQQLSQLQKQIQSQQLGKEREQLVQEHQSLEQQISDQIENVSNIGNSLGITIAFIQDLKKELSTIQEQLKELNSKMNDMSMDIKFLIGKSPQQLLEIRMEKVLKQKMIDDARSVYVQLYTYEMDDFDQKKECTKRTPLFNSNDEQDGEIDEFVNTAEQGSLLVHGPAGSGKSTAAKKVEEYLWIKYKAQQIRNWDDSKDVPIIPIFIQLPTLKDPKFRALQETLKSSNYLFNDKQIGDLQKVVQNKKIKLFIIMDSYDELNKDYIEQQLNITNKFEQWCDGSNYQILNTTRSEIFTTMDICFNNTTLNTFVRGSLYMIEQYIITYIYVLIQRKVKQNQFQYMYMSLRKNQKYSLELFIYKITLSSIIRSIYTVIIYKYKLYKDKDC